MKLNRYFIYEWLAPTPAHCRYLRVAYDATRQLAEEQRQPLVVGANPKVLLCGVGRSATAESFCEFLRDNFPKAEVTLFDLRRTPLDKAFPRIAKNNLSLRVEIRTGDVLAMPFADATFDWIETDHFLQFFPPDQLPLLVAEWRRVLKPGGLVTTRFLSPDKTKLNDCISAAIWSLFSWFISAPCHLHPAEKIREAFSGENFLTLTRPFPAWPSERITSLVAFKDRK